MMECQKSRHFKISAVLLIGALLPGFVNSGERDDLYESGLKAYESDNYVLALKNLFAFYVLNQKNVDKNKDFKKKLLRRISKSESIIENSLRENAIESWSSKDSRVLEKQSGVVLRGTGKEIEDLLKMDLDTIDRNIIIIPSDKVD